MKFKLKNMIVQCLLGLAAVAVSSQATAQVTFYENSDFQGRSFSTGERVANFRDAGFNDRASSVIVLSRRWEVCEHAQFDGRCVVLRPGRYQSTTTTPPATATVPDPRRSALRHCAEPGAA